MERVGGVGGAIATTRAVAAVDTESWCDCGRYGRLTRLRHQPSVNVNSYT